MKFNRNSVYSRSAVVTAVVLLAILSTSIEIGWMFICDEMKENERWSLIMVCRVLTEYIETERGCPGSWEELLAFVPIKNKWGKGEWPRDAELIKPILVLPFGVQLCSPRGEELSSGDVTPRLSGSKSWNNEGYLRWMLTIYGTEVDRMAKIVCSEEM